MVNDVNESEVIWKPINGFEGYYEVSNTGLIKSLNRTIVNKRGNPVEFQERILSPGRINEYLFVVLCKDSKYTSKPVHRLVAETFVENLLKVKSVNHKDFNKQNNHADNLEWLTLSENIAKSTVNKKRGETHGNSKLTEEIVKSIMEDKRQARLIAEEHGICAVTVSMIRTGKTWKHITNNPNRVINML